MLCRYRASIADISTKHGAQAARILSNFDNVLVLEEKDLAGRLLEEVLGWWNCSDLNHKIGRRRHTKEEVDTAVVNHIRMLNAQDMLVYKIAQTIAKLDTILFLAPFNASTRRTSTSTPLTCNNPEREYPAK